jgi:hypothetical protein
MSKELLTETDRREFRKEWGIVEAGTDEAPAWMTNTPTTSDAMRAKSDKHSRIADGLVSGDAKDSHNVASIKANRAAKAIDAAHLASRKAEAFE